MSDDGEVMAVRHGDWKFVLGEQRAEQMRVWMEPFDKLGVPLIFNLRRDPFERAQHNSNTYYDWMMDHAFLLYEMQALVAEQIDGLREVPAAPEAGVVQPRRGHAAGEGPSPVAIEDAGMADVAATVRTSTSATPIRRRSRASTRYGGSGTDRQAPRRRITCSGPARPFRDDPSILVAGCGTSQAAKHALRWPAARVTGIDFSATSVRCTEELKRKYDLDNLEVRQLPIERVGELGATLRSDRLHGRAASPAPIPTRGCARCASVLAPGGAMHLMVYAPYGRTGIYMLQEFCRRLGIDSRPTRRSATWSPRCGALPPGHPLATLLRDGARLSRCRRRSPTRCCIRRTAPTRCRSCSSFSSGGGLTFGRWVRQAPYSPGAASWRRLPQAARIARLPPAEQYAAVELFRGTMVRHSVIAYRDDGAGRRAPIGFAGDAWQRLRADPHARHDLSSRSGCRPARRRC